MISKEFLLHKQTISQESMIQRMKASLFLLIHLKKVCHFIPKLFFSHTCEHIHHCPLQVTDRKTGRQTETDRTAHTNMPPKSCTPYFHPLPPICWHTAGGQTNWDRHRHATKTCTPFFSFSLQHSVNCTENHSVPTHRHKVFGLVTLIKDEAALKLRSSTPVDQLLQSGSACVVKLPWKQAHTIKTTAKCKQTKKPNNYINSKLTVELPWKNYKHAQSKQQNLNKETKQLYQQKTNC